MDRIVRHPVITALVGCVLAAFLYSRAPDQPGNDGLLSFVTGATILLFMVPLVCVIIRDSIRWVARTAHDATKD